MNRRMAMVEVSSELLLQALCLPADTLLCHVQEGQFGVGGPRTVILYLEHPDLKEVPMGSLCPQAEPRLRREPSGQVVFEGWGQ